jgi:hypothetical protein
MKRLTIVNFFISSSALAFQISVLYPWHMQLDKEFKELRDKHEKTLNDFHEIKVTKMNTIEHKISQLHELLFTQK